MNKRINVGKKEKSKGFFVAVLLCVVGVVVAGFAAINGVINTQEQTKNNTANQEEQAWGLDDFVSDPVEKKQPQVVVQPDLSSKSQNGELSDTSDTNSSKTSNASTQLPKVQASQYVRPVTGDVLQAFSGEELIYNPTMQDWRTHNGTDYAAEKGIIVFNIMQGVVKSVVDDAVWGKVVEVESGDYLIRYMGLSDGTKLKAGDSIIAGDEIGKIGEAYAEISEKSHLHIEVEQAGALIDPERLFG